MQEALQNISLDHALEPGAMWTWIHTGREKNAGYILHEVKTKNSHEEILRHGLKNDMK